MHNSPAKVNFGLRRLAAALRVAPDNTGATSTENPAEGGTFIGLTVFPTSCGDKPHIAADIVKWNLDRFL